MEFVSDPYAAPHGLPHASEASNWTDAEQQIDEYLGEAAAFANGGDPPGAVARAHWIRAELSRLAARLPPNERLFEELRSAVEQAIAEYHGVLRAWQEENTSRHASYLEREQAAIAQPTTLR